MRETPTAAGRDAMRQLRAERSRVPRVVDPWAEDGDQLRAARGITLGTVLCLGVWTLVAIVALLVLAVLA